MSTEASVTCPNCSRNVEPGFKFCDFCGTKLVADDPEPAEARPTEPDPEPTRKAPLFERMRNKRLTESDDDVVDEPTPPTPPEPEPEPEPTAARPVPGITSRPMKAQDLRSDQRKAGFAGRVRWREGETMPDQRTEAAPKTEPVPTPPPPAWRPAEHPRRSPVRTVLVFLVHLVVAFLAGAVLLGIAAVVASMTSNGRVALLEVRGLPIFIAGATAIVVFSLLRTGPRSEGGRRAVALSVVIGFVVLVGAVALTYRPSLMATAQRELDQRLGVYGPEVAEAVEKFEGDVAQWNLEVDNYRTDLLAVTNAQEREPDAIKRAAALEEFRVAASGVEAALEGNQKRMIAHAESIEQAPLRDALTDLASIFDDELAGIKLLTRGFVADDQSMIKRGDTSFKDATARAVDFFADRVRPILERAEIDADQFEAEVAELTRRS